MMSDNLRREMGGAGKFLASLSNSELQIVCAIDVNGDLHLEKDVDARCFGKLRQFSSAERMEFVQGHARMIAGGPGVRYQGLGVR